MNEEEYTLYKQSFHWLTIREKKNKDTDKRVNEIIDGFKAFSKEYGMNNHVTSLGILLDAYFSHNYLIDELESRVSALELSLMDLTKDKETVQKKEQEKEVPKSTL